MTLAFAPGVSACEADGQLILLDVRRDRYRRLVGGAEQCVRALIAGQVDADAIAASTLIEQGVLVASDGAAPPTLAHAPPAVRSALDADAPGRLPARELGSAARDLLAARWRLRVGGLSAALESGVLASARVADADVNHAGTLANRFESVRRALSGQGRCLPDSLALRMFLARRGVRSELVLAVRAAPFGAHCWVQSGALVLNESIDGIRAFTPILVR